MQSNQQSEAEKGETKKEESDEEMDFIVLPELTQEQKEQFEIETRERLLNFYGKNKKYEIDHWYDAIKQFTYRSQSFPLSVHEAYLLQAKYYGEAFTESDREALQSLMKKVNRVLEQAMPDYEEKDRVFFMKLSTRSPKDNCWDYRDQIQQKRAVERLIKYLHQNEVTLDCRQDKFHNLLYRFFLENSKDKLKVRSADNFFHLFSRSERIIQDINDLAYLRQNIFEKLKKEQLTQQEKNSEFIKVWVREWSDCSWEEEFRVFYKDYQVTAISQYDERCYFEGLALQKQAIKTRVLAHFEKMKGNLKNISLSEGVMDVIVKAEADSIMTVEINVFDANARASLFSWVKDRQQLENGPPEIRVLQDLIQISRAQLTSMMGLIEKNNEKVIIEALKSLNLEQLWGNND